MAKITQNVVSFVSILEPKEETVTCGTAYKFALLDVYIIRSLWEIGNKFVLKNPNYVRPMAFKRRFRGLLHDQISNIEYPK